MIQVTITGYILLSSSTFTDLVRFVTIKQGRNTLSIKPDSYFPKSELIYFNLCINAPTMQITKTEKLAESTD